MMMSKYSLHFNDKQEEQAFTENQVNRFIKILKVCLILQGIVYILRLIYILTGQLQGVYTWPLVQIGCSIFSYVYISYKKQWIVVVPTINIISLAIIIIFQLKTAYAFQMQAIGFVTGLFFGSVLLIFCCLSWHWYINGINVCIAFIIFFAVVRDYQVITEDYLIYTAIIYVLIIVFKYQEEKNLRQIFYQDYHNNITIESYHQIFKEYLPLPFLIYMCKTTQPPQIIFLNQKFKEEFKIQTIEQAGILLEDIEVQILNQNLYSSGNTEINNNNHVSLEVIIKNLYLLYDKTNQNFHVFERAKFIQSQNEETEFNEYDILIKKINYLNYTSYLILLNNVSSQTVISRLRNLDKYKDKLLAIVSHDLKTPTNAITSMIDLLLQQPVSQQIKDSLVNIQSSAQLLLCMIHDILDIAQIKQKCLKINKQNFNLISSIQHTIKIIEPQALIKGLKIILTTENDIPDVIFSDIARLKQVILNLLSNSLKFTSCGYINIIIKYHQLSKLIFITVSDTGSGIKPADQHKLFHMFSKLDDQEKINTQGTGLGLYICKQLVGFLGPNQYINVQSSENQGTKFSFIIYENLDQKTNENDKQYECFQRDEYFKFKQMSNIIQINQENNDNQQVYSLLQQKQNVNYNQQIIETLSSGQQLYMIVDDIPFNIQIMQANIKSIVPNAKFIIAYNGQEAVNKFKNIQQIPNIIFMDIQMPVMDGFQATQSIKNILKEYQGLSPIPKIVALSGYQEKEISDDQRFSLFDYYLEKPIPKEKLKNLLINL